MYRRTRGAVAFALALLVAAPLFAQEQTRLTGVVTDSQGAVLPGVTVTAASPALIGTKTAVTEAGGKYMFASLAPGRYTLTFELPGFQTVKRENIALALSQTLTIDALLQIASVRESVTVTSQSPVIDITSTKVGNDFTGEKLTGIPTATDVWAALGQAPGVRMQGFDVGGSHKISQTNYETFGITGQNRVVTDGVDTTEGDSGTGFYQDYFAQQEISVSAAGGDVTMNSPGAALISTIKSGGNRFRSLDNVAYEPGRLVGNNIDRNTAAHGFTGQPNLQFWELHGDVGGPIKKDKLWFYGALNKFKINKAISGQDPKIVTSLGVSRNRTGKVTLKASDKDTISAYYQWEWKDMPYRGLNATTGIDSILAQHSPTSMWDFVYQRVWTNRLFTELRGGRFGYDWPMAPSVDYRTHPPRTDTVTNMNTGAGWLANGSLGPYDMLRDKPQLFALMTYYLPSRIGSHDLKAGYERLSDRQSAGRNGASGPILYLDYSGKPNQIRLTDYGTPETYGKDWTGGENRNERWALFFQDRWSMTNRVTVTGGVRFDHQTPGYLPSIRKPVLSDIFSAQTTPGGTFLTSNKAAPRLGLAWDLTGGGKNVVKVFYGRYYFNFSTNLSGANPGGANTKDYVFLDCTLAGVPAACTTPGAVAGNGIYDGPQELGAPVGSTGGTSTTVDPKLVTPYTDEISGSYERQMWGEGSLRVAYVRKMSREQYNTRNVLRDGQFTVPYSTTINLVDYNGTKTGVVESAQTFTVYDIPASLKGKIRNMISTAPDMDYTYDTLQLAMNKRFTSGLFAQASFDYMWRNELRSNSGSTSSNGSDPIGAGFFQNVYPTVSNRQKTTTWQARLMGRYTFKYGIGAAANFMVNSGWTYTRLLSVNLPNAGRQTFFMDNLTDRSSRVALLSLRADKSFDIGHGRQVTLMLDVFNIVNTNVVANFEVTNGPNYGLIYNALDPRTLQLGARVSF